MPHSHLVRGTHQHSRAGTPTPGYGHRRPVTTWVRTLAAVVLLDPNALSRDADSAPGRSVPRDPAATAPGPDAALDAAAALIVTGDTGAGFLLLALTQPAPHRPDHTQGPDPT